MTSVQLLDLPVPGGRMRALRFGAGPQRALAVHGLTASAMAWQTVARELPADWSLIAVDLRGRGHSADLPGPFGIRWHAADIITVAATLGEPAPVLIGHSMGAYITVHAAAARPDLFSRLVLVDGGLELSMPPDKDPDDVLAATIGPALDRLRRMFASESEYLDFFRAHPAFTEAWNEDIEAYVRYDLTGVDGQLCSRVSAEAVRQDGRDLLLSSDALGVALRSLTLPAALLLAPSGMLGQPPGLIPAATVEEWRELLPELAIETVEGSNHYTILLSPDPARTVARRIADPSSWPTRTDHSQ
jgi:pimeloyl-ACP methyl ester carboxylesterase